MRRVCSGSVLLLIGFALAGCRHHKGPKVKADSTESKPSRSSRARGRAASEAWQRPTTAAWSIDDLSGSCTLPVHKDEYAGFSIGRPPGWIVDYGSGTISVTKDESNLEGALVFPGRVRKADVTADSFADYFAKSLGRSIAENGGTFALDGRISDGHLARANASATVGGVKLRGALNVVAEQGFVTAKLWWAPEESFGAEEDKLRQIVTCFHRQMLVTAKAPTPPPGGHVTRVGGAPPKPGAAPTPAAPSVAMKPFQSRYFTGSMPEGWSVKNETANGIDLASADQMLAVGFGWVQNPITRPPAMVQANIARFHPDARIITSGPTANPPPGWFGYSAEYESGMTHGIDSASMSQSVEVMSSLLAPPARWAAVKDTLAAIARSIQVTPNGVATVNAQIRAQLATYPKPAPSTTSSSSSSSSSWQSSWEARQASQDKNNQAFDDAILGQDRATSPSSGEQYVVPWSAWNPSGPQGAGYYRALPGGGTELLNVPP